MCEKMLQQVFKGNSRSNDVQAGSNNIVDQQPSTSGQDEEVLTAQQWYGLAEDVPRMLKVPSEVLRVSRDPGRPMYPFPEAAFISRDPFSFPSSRGYFR